MKSNQIVLIVCIALGVIGIACLAGYFIRQTESNYTNQFGPVSTSQNSTVITPTKTVTTNTCNADELNLRTGPANPAAGSTTYSLIFTNTGARTCTLYGYPGVSLVNANGNQIGSPAVRVASNTPEKTYTLQPGYSVQSFITTTESGNYDAGVCKEGATKMRVYPPNDIGYLSIAAVTDSWCPGFTVSPVQTN